MSEKDESDIMNATPKQWSTSHHTERRRGAISPIQKWSRIGVVGSPEIRSETALTSPIHLSSFLSLSASEDYIAPDSAVNKKVTTYGGRSPFFSQSLQCATSVNTCICFPIDGFKFTFLHFFLNRCACTIRTCRTYGRRSNVNEHGIQLCNE